MIVVYSKPSCVQCKATVRALDERGLAYDYIDVTEDQEAFDFVTNELGYKQVPVVYIDAKTHWSGFMPDKIKGIA